MPTPKPPTGDTARDEWRPVPRCPVCENIAPTAGDSAKRGAVFTTHTPDGQPSTVHGSALVVAGGHRLCRGAGKPVPTKPPLADRSRGYSARRSRGDPGPLFRPVRDASDGS